MKSLLAWDFLVVSYSSMDQVFCPRISHGWFDAASCWDNDMSTMISLTVEMIAMRQRIYLALSQEKLKSAIRTNAMQFCNDLMTWLIESLKQRSLLCKTLKFCLSPISLCPTQTCLKWLWNCFSFLLLLFAFIRTYLARRVTKRSVFPRGSKSQPDLYTV